MIISHEWPPATVTLCSVSKLGGGNPLHHSMKPNLFEKKTPLLVWLISVFFGGHEKTSMIRSLLIHWNVKYWSSSRQLRCSSRSHPQVINTFQSLINFEVINKFNNRDRRRRSDQICCKEEEEGEYESFKLCMTRWLTIGTKIT